MDSSAELRCHETLFQYKMVLLVDTNSTEISAARQYFCNKKYCQIDQYEKIMYSPICPNGMTCLMLMCIFSELVLLVTPAQCCFSPLLSQSS